MRLTLWYIAVLAVVLVVFATFVYKSQAQNLLSQTEDRLRRQGQALATQYDPADGMIHPAAYLDNLKAPGKLSPGQSIPKPEVTDADQQPLPANDLMIVLDKDGNLVQSIGQLSQADTIQVLIANGVAQTGQKTPQDVANVTRKVQEAEQHYLADGSGGDPLAGLGISSTRTAETTFTTHLLDSQVLQSGVSPDFLFYSTIIMVKNQQAATLILGMPRDDEAQLQSLLLTLLLATPATLLLSAIGGYWLATRAMRPVRVITRAAGDISESDLHRRLNLGSNDELGELAATFDRMLDRLEAAFKRQRQFTTDASHELRTPLTIVNLEVNRALSQPRTPGEYREALATIQTENEQMAHLVNDLLVLARADAGQALLRCEQVDISDVALDVVERLLPLANQQGVELSTGDLPELEVTGDRVYLSQMITNLVENAIKYSTGNCKQVRIETSAATNSTRASQALVRVSDSGPGIAPEHLAHIFERFYRVDKARTHPGDSPTQGNDEMGGSGLGLSIVQWVAQAHGGSVTVESHPGEGSVFEVKLPLASSDAKNDGRPTR